MQEMTLSEIDDISGGVTGLQFAGYAFAIAGGVIAIATAPAWGAIGGLCAVAAIGANALNAYATE